MCIRDSHRAVDIGKHLELWRAADVVAVAAGAITDDLVTFVLTDLARFKGLDHAGCLTHAANPFVALDAHACLAPGLGVIVSRA